MSLLTLTHSRTALSSFQKKKAFCRFFLLSFVLSFPILSVTLPIFVFPQFAIILSLIVITEIGAGIAGYIFRGKVNELLDQSFHTMIAGYNKTEEYRTSLDSIQMQLKCCGGNSSTDWVNFSADHISVPDSCCRNVTKNCGFEAMTKPTVIYTEGCQPILETRIKENILWIAVGALVIGFVQITGIVLACILSRAIRSGYEVM